MNRGLLFVMSGPSGTGKGTLCDEVMNRYDGLCLSVSSTTREMRKGEQDGVTYNYTTVDNFKKMIDNGDMLEWAEYNGNYYGTPRATVEKMLSEGKSVMLEIEPKGALKVKELFPEAKLIFIVPPSMAELKRRLVSRGRGETQEQIKERMETARWEIAQSEKYSVVMMNDDLERCTEEVLEYISRKNWEAQAAEALLNENIE